MRIGVDGTCWANRRGYGRYARELFRAMVREAPDQEFVCFVDEVAAGVPGMDGPNVKKVRVPQSVSPTRAASADGNRSLLDMLRFSRAVWNESLDVFFSPSVYTYFPLPPGLPAVIGIHDAIAERFPSLTLPSVRARFFWRLKVGMAIRQARLILTVSDFASTEISEVHGVPQGRIRVAVEAPAPVYRPEEDPVEIRRVAERIGLPPMSRWFIYVGGFNPHKNVDLLVGAHGRLVREAARDGREPPYLVLVGDLESDVFHGSLEQIRECVARGGASDRVIWTGFVEDEELRRLHTGALALALPSECEGFGLPAVEAAACGCPVVATTASPLPDLLRDGGVFVNPGDEDALLDALRLLADEEETRARMGRWARQRADALCWSEAASTTMATLREAAA